MVSANIDYVMWAAIFVMFGIFYVNFIHPELFKRKGGPKVKSPRMRPREKLVDQSIPGGIAEVHAQTQLGNGMVELELFNEHGTFMKRYSESEIMPLNKSQQLCSNNGVMFITAESAIIDDDQKSALIKDSINKQKDAVKKMDYFKREYKSLKATKDVAIQEEIKRATDLMNRQPQRPEWGPAK